MGRGKKTCFLAIVIMAGTMLLCIFLNVFIENTINFMRIVNTTEYKFTASKAVRCISTETKPSFYVCTHKPEKDIFISKSLLSSGIWEPKTTALFQSILRTSRDLTVLDIGANVGYYTLMAAAAGHYVVAVEPNKGNIKLLVKAIQMNGFENTVTLLNNAVSDSERIVTLDISSPNNQGAARVVSDSEVMGSERKTVKIPSIPLDSLVDLIPSRNVVIKIDVEGHECRVLARSTKLFTIFHVTYILTEWSKMTSVRHRYGVACAPDNIRQVALMLDRIGFIPYDSTSKLRLDVTKSDSWRNNDVYWRNTR